MALLWMVVMGIAWAPHGEFAMVMGGISGFLLGSLMDD